MASVPLIDSARERVIAALALFAVATSCAVAPAPTPDNTTHGRTTLAEHLHARYPGLVAEFSQSLSDRLPGIPDHQLEAVLELRPRAARDRVGRLRRTHDSFSWRPGVDEHIVKVALKAGVGVAYLETWDEPAELLDHSDQQYYVNELRDLAGSPYDLLDIELPSELRAGREVERRLLFETREHRWVQRILATLEETNAETLVVAVGAGHVDSEATVLPELLSSAGFVPRAEAETGIHPALPTREVP